MPSSETEHGHGGSIVSDEGREMVAVGIGGWRGQRDGRRVVCKGRRLDP